MASEEEEKKYIADNIQVLEGLEAVRKRPAMYIGDISARGLHHLVYEVVDNSIDEALAGFANHIEVTILEDNSIKVVDNGRGIPVDMHEKMHKPALEVVLTVLHAGGKFGGGGYKVSGGLHGVGASVVNALSTWLEVRIYHEGKIYQQRYERGKTMYPLKVVGDCQPDKTGTTVVFLPDKEIFEETVYDYDILKQRLREMAFLTKGLKISLKDTREGMEREKVFHYEGGIREFVSYLNRSKEALYPEIIYCEGQQNGVSVEVAMQHNDSYTENCYGFVNNINTPEGGAVPLKERGAQTHAGAVFAVETGFVQIVRQKNQHFSFRVLVAAEGVQTFLLAEEIFCHFQLPGGEKAGGGGDILPHSRVNFVPELRQKQPILGGLGDFFNVHNGNGKGGYRCPARRRAERVPPGLLQAAVRSGGIFLLRQLRLRFFKSIGTTGAS